MELVVLQKAHGRPHTHTNPGAEHANEAAVGGMFGVVMRGVDGFASVVMIRLVFMIMVVGGDVEVGLGGCVLYTRIETEDEELESTGDDLMQRERDLVLRRVGSCWSRKQGGCCAAHCGSSSWKLGGGSLALLYGCNQGAQVEDSAAEHEGDQGCAVPLRQCLGDDA